MEQMDDPTNDLLLRDFYLSKPKKRDYLCIGCGSVIITMTLSNALLIYGFYHLFQKYRGDFTEFNHIRDETFLHNETAVKDVLQKIPILVNHFCNILGC